MGDHAGLFKTGAFAALVVLALIPVQMAVFIVFPPPATAVEWFLLFQRSAVIGLLHMDLLLIVDYVLMAVIFLAMSAALHRVSPSMIAIALMLELLGVAAYFASATAMEMLTLSRFYARAPTETDRAAVRAAGEALLATWDGTAFTFSYELSGIAIFLLGLVMLRSPLFGHTGAYAAVAVGALSLIPANAGIAGLICSILALVPTVVWLAFAARDLFRLSRSAPV